LVTDVSALGGLTGLRTLQLGSNLISDIGGFEKLTNLEYLNLSNNSISDIGPLLNNPGIGAGDTVVLQDNPVDCADVAALRAKGVTVYSDCE
jgi:hypothetical protein